MLTLLCSVCCFGSLGYFWSTFALSAHCCANVARSTITFHFHNVHFQFFYLKFQIFDLDLLIVYNVLQCQDTLHCVLYLCDKWQIKTLGIIKDSRKMHDHFDQEPLLTAKVCNKEGTQEQLYQPRNNFNIRNQTKWHMHTSYSPLIYIFLYPSPALLLSDVMP